MADHWLLTTPQPALPTPPTSVSFLPSDPFPASSPREPLSRHGQWRSLSLPASPLLSPRTQLPATPLHLDVLPARPVHCLIFLKLCHATFTSALQCRVFRLGTVSVLNPGGRVSVPTPCPRDPAVLPSSLFRAPLHLLPPAWGSPCAHTAPSAGTLPAFRPDRCSWGPRPPGSSPASGAPQPGRAELLLMRSEVKDPVASSLFRLDTAPSRAAVPDKGTHSGQDRQRLCEQLRSVVGLCWACLPFSSQPGLAGQLPLLGVGVQCHPVSSSGSPFLSIPVALGFSGAGEV